MEIKVEAADGCDMPTNSYVSVKMGDALKQGRYEPARAYVFPKANKRVYAKIDVFKHVGTQSILVNPDGGTTVREVDITSSDPTVDSLRLKVDITSKSPDVKPTKPTKTEVRDKAAAYLEKHRIEDRLSKCMKALLQSQPDDPIGFFCCALQGKPYQASEAHAKQSPHVDTSRGRQNYCAKENTEGSLEGASIDVDSVRAALVQGSNDGSLFDLLQAGKSPSVAQDAPLLPQAKPQNQSGMLTAEGLESKRVDNLCMHATDVLLKASQDGVLREVISSTKLASSDDQNISTLKSRACLTLAAASQDGSLEHVLADMVEDDSNSKLPLVEMKTTKTPQQKIVLGLAESASAVADTCPVSAAGLAKAAAEVAEELRAILGPTCSVSPGVVTGLAEMASSVAAVGSPSAPGLIEAAVAVCVEIARTAALQ